VLHYNLARWEIVGAIIRSSMSIQAMIVAEAQREVDRVLSTHVPKGAVVQLGCQPGSTRTQVLTFIATQHDSALVKILQRIPSLFQLFVFLKTSAFCNAALALGVPVDMVDPYTMRTRLGMAAFNGDLACAYTLMKAGADPKLRAPCGLTAHDELVDGCTKTCGTFCLGCPHETVKHLLLVGLPAE